MKIFPNHLSQDSSAKFSLVSLDVSRLLLFVLCFSFLNFLVACGGSGGGSGNSEAPAGELPDEGEFISLISGQPVTLTETFAINLEGAGGPFETLTIDESDVRSIFEAQIAAATPGWLQKLSPFFIEKAFAQMPNNTVRATFALGRAELGDDICEEGEQYGPYTMTYSALEIIGFDFETITASQNIVDVVNTGFLRVCVEIVASSNTQLQVASVVPSSTVARTDCSSLPSDIDGVWSGTYTCDGACPEGGDIELTIEQDGTTATYSDDGGANYSGTVCGDRFSFSGGVPGSYAESGTFVLNSSDPSMAIKTSSWTDLVGSCGSANPCSDDLSRD